jgi:hypothetical protein
MAGCDIEAISALTDGELSEDAASSLHRHLDECPSCRALLEDFKALRQGLGGLDAEPPDTLMPGILYKIDLGEDPPRKGRVIKSLIAVAACAAVVFFIMRPETPTDPEVSGDAGNAYWEMSADAPGAAPDAAVYDYADFISLLETSGQPFAELDAPLRGGSPRPGTRYIFLGEILPDVRDYTVYEHKAGDVTVVIYAGEEAAVFVRETLNKP